MFLKDEHFTFFRSISFPLSCIMERNLYPLPLAVCVCMPPHGAILRVNASFHLLFPFLQCENSFPSDYWGEVAAAAASFQKMTLKKCTTHQPMWCYSLSLHLFSLCLSISFSRLARTFNGIQNVLSVYKEEGRENHSKRLFHSETLVLLLSLAHHTR